MIPFRGAGALPKGMQDPPFQPEFYPGEMERWAADTKEAEDFEAAHDASPIDADEPTPF